MSRRHQRTAEANGLEIGSPRCSSFAQVPDGGRSPGDQRSPTLAHARTHEAPQIPKPFGAPDRALDLSSEISESLWWKLSATKSSSRLDALHI